MFERIHVRYAYVKPKNILIDIFITTPSLENLMGVSTLIDIKSVLTFEK